MPLILETSRVYTKHTSPGDALERKLNNGKIKSVSSSIITPINTWKSFIRSKPDLADTHNITLNLYLQIVSDYNQEIYKAMLHKAYSFTLGYKLGTLCLEWRKSPTSKKIDYHQTKLQGQTVYHDNKHSKGKYAYCKWYKSQTVNISVYKFSFIRVNKRNIAKAAKEDTLKII